MAKDVSINLNAQNLIRNAQRAAEELDKIVQSMRSITSASASMEAKTKNLEGSLRGVTRSGIEFSASFTKAKEALKLTAIAVANTTGNLVTLNLEARKLAKLDVASEKLQGLVVSGQQLQLTKEETALRSKLARIEAARVASQKRLDHFTRVRAATAEVAARNKLARIMAHVARLEAPQRLAKQTQQANKVAKELHINWTSVVRLLSAQLIYRAVFGLAAQLREAFTNAVELQVALAEIQTISPTTETFSGFARVLREVSDEFGVDIIESAEAAYQALSNQIVDTASEMRRFLTVTNLLAIATRSTADDSVSLLTGVLNAYRLEVEDAVEISSKLFKIVELGRVRANEMANSLGNVAILANQVGLSFDELGGLITTLTVQGIKFSEAQTQIRGILIKLIKPTKDMKQFLAELGFESGEAAIKALGLVGFLEQMSRKTGDSTTEIAKLINRVRGLSGTLAVTGKGFNLLRKNIDEIATKSMPAFRRATEIVLGNIGKRFQIFQNQLKNFFTQDIGQDFLEALSLLTGGFTNLLGVMKFVTNAIIASAVPVIVIALSTITASVIKAMIALRAFSLVAFNLQVGVFALASAFSALIFLMRKWESRTERMVAGLEAIEKATQKVSDTIQETMLDVLDETVDKFNEVASLLSGGLATTAAFNLGSLAKAITSVEGLFENLGDTFEKAFDAAGDKIDQILEDWEDAIENTRERLKQIGAEFLDVVVRAQDRELELKLSAATEPKEQIKLLTAELVRLQTALTTTKDIDTFEDLQQRIEKVLDRINKAQGKDVTKELKNANKLIADRIKLEKRREAIIKKGEKAIRPGKTAAGKPKPIDRRRVQELLDDLRKVEAQIRDVEDEINKARIGGARVKIGTTAEDTAALAQAARDEIAKRGIQVSNDAAAAAQKYLNILTQVAEKELVRLELKEAADLKLKESFDTLKEAIEAVDQDALEELFAATDPEAVKRSQKQLEQLITNLRKFAALQDQLGEDSSGTRARADLLEANKASELERQELKVRAKALQDRRAELEVATELHKVVRLGLTKEIELREQLLNAALALTKVTTARTLERGAGGEFAIEETLSISNEALKSILKESENNIDALVDIQKLLGDFLKTGDPGIRDILIPALEDLLQKIELPTVPPGEGATLQKREDFEAGLAIQQRIIDLLRQLTLERRGVTDDQEAVKTLKEIRNDFKASLDADKALIKEGNQLLRELKEAGLIQVKTFEEATVDFNQSVNNFGQAIKDLLDALPSGFAGPPAPATPHHGGLIRGSGNADTVPALLTPGEFVVNKQSASKFFSQLMSMNRDRSPVTENISQITKHHGGIVRSPKNTTSATTLNKHITNKKSTSKSINSLVEANRNRSSVIRNFNQKLIEIFPTSNFHHGGIVQGSGNGDTVPAMLTPGEFVINKQSTSKFINRLIGINRDHGTPAKFQQGGSVEVGGISINVSESKTPQATAKAVAAEINRGVRTGTIQLRSNR